MDSEQSVGSFELKLELHILDTSEIYIYLVKSNMKCSINSLNDLLRIRRSN